MDEEKIRFKNLSLSLKIPIVMAWFLTILYAAVFIYEFLRTIATGI